MSPPVGLQQVIPFVPLLLSFPFGDKVPPEHGGSLLGHSSGTSLVGTLQVEQVVSGGSPWLDGQLAHLTAVAPGSQQWQCKRGKYGSARLTNAPTHQLATAGIGGHGKHILLSRSQVCHPQGAVVSGWDRDPQPRAAPVRQPHLHIAACGRSAVQLVVGNLEWAEAVSCLATTAFLSSILRRNYTLLLREIQLPRVSSHCPHKVYRLSVCITTYGMSVSSLHTESTDSKLACAHCPRITVTYLLPALRGEGSWPEEHAGVGGVQEEGRGRSEGGRGGGGEGRPLLVLRQLVQESEGLLETENNKSCAVK